MHQYLKNGFIFLPAFFSFQLLHEVLLLKVAVVFISFSFCASGIYILNDILDLAEDKAHPVKQYRPIASGKVLPSQALLVMAGLLACGISLLGAIDWVGLPFLLIYVLMNVAYSFGLKHVSLLDIVMIAIGFVLRVLAGAAAVGVSASMWIILMTFLLAVFLGSAKRRDDVLLQSRGLQTRKNIDGYNLEFLNAIMVLMASVTIMAYVFYTISAEIRLQFQSDSVYLTTLFVLLGILRYMQLTFVEEKSGSPTQLLMRDRFLQLSILGWLSCFVWLMYT
jgi:4-hydroxybenzoate polyprenyltransferase